LKSFHLPAFATHYEELARKAETEACTYERYLHSLAQLEAYERRHRKIELLLKQSRLPREKTLRPSNRTAYRRRFGACCRLCAKAAF